MNKEIDFTEDLEFPERKFELPLTEEIKNELILNLLSLPEEKKGLFRDSVVFLAGNKKELKKDRKFISEWKTRKLGYGAKEELTEEIKELVKNFPFKKYFQNIRKILKDYMELDEPYYDLISIWIIGTYLHKQFETYPYLYFNAMKGSGKSRLLKIIANLSHNGKILGSMTEAVLFRTAGDRTLCMDEFEKSNAKGSENLSLLLNSAYKKGLTIERMAKRKSLEGEEQVVESFEVYCPISMANIWGMENTLSDRCIGIILEKSSKTEITKLIENFGDHPLFEEVRKGLSELPQKISNYVNLFGGIFEKWNSYQRNIVNEVSKVSIVKNVKNVRDSYDIYDIYDFTTLFKHIDKTNLSGRDLELFFPLYLLANFISEEVLMNLLETSKEIVKEKRESDRDENRDVRLIEFISQYSEGGYVEVSKIVKSFQLFLGEEEKWINSRGISRALNRLKLILDKRNTGKSRQVKLNLLKAKEKLLMFKEPSKELEPQVEYEKVGEIFK